MKLKALKYMRYAGKRVIAGDVFDANAADVRVLLAVKHAVLYVEPVARVTKSIVRAPVVQVVEPEPAGFSISENFPYAVSNEPKVEAAKRTYKRRDLTAE